MKYVWDTNNEPKLLEVYLKLKRPQEIVITVEDCDRPNTFYSKQTTVVPAGDDVFEISLPLTPKKAFFEIASVNNQKNNLPWQNYEQNFTFSVKELPFASKWTCNHVSKNALLQDFLKFSSWFSQNAGVLSAAYNNEDTVYRSPSKNFTLRYVPEIVDDEPYVNVSGRMMKNPNFGNPLPTSFRVHTVTKSMELAQKYVLTYTIPQRMVLFTHEFAHGWLNADPDDEFEADYNSLLICRCLGFSKREIGDAYAQVFLRYPSNENVKRMEAIINTLGKLN